VRNADRISAGLLLAFAVAFSAGALKYYAYWGDAGPGSAFLPFWLGVVMAALAVLMLARNPHARDAGSDWIPRGEGRRHVLVVLAVTVAFVAALKVVGMILGTALFLVVLMRYLGRHAWWLTIAIAAAAAGFNYLVFVHWLRVPFPEGMLWIF
jgi:putative tricarboxylic transport membrane protein